MQKRGGCKGHPLHLNDNVNCFMTDMFHHKKVVIATQHQKEKVIAPLLVNNWSMQVITPIDIDTDVLGTFTGEVQRTLDPVAAMRRKCELALQYCDADFAFASEGSFGPHPQLFFSTADDEMVMLFQAKTGKEWVAREISSETNFDAGYIHSWNEMLDFAHKINFPSHGLILRKSPDSSDDMHKGIQDEGDLKQMFMSLQMKHGRVYAETDMRAMFNPMRMKVIERATKKLVEQLEHKCPSCAFPGFSVKQVIPGLPCMACGMPTRSTSAWMYVCQDCGLSEKKLFPHEKTEEDPMYCDFCNP
jgi:hypothetical protein